MHLSLSFEAEAEIDNNQTECRPLPDCDFSAVENDRLFKPRPQPTNFCTPYVSMTSLVVLVSVLVQRRKYVPAGDHPRRSSACL